VPSNNLAERHLPKDILDRASLRGNEYAWAVSDIPLVVQAAREANLINLGGQLQFRLVDGSTCECYWVEVNTSKTVPESLPWRERVVQTATVALDDFAALSSRFDFFEEGRRSFTSAFAEAEARGDDPHDAMCFVWYVVSAPSVTER
jgi:hypothetical protein